MRDTLSDVIPTAVQMAGSLEEAIRLVDEEVDKDDCMPISKELRDKRIEIGWQEKVNGRRWHILNQVVKRVLEDKGTLPEAIRQAREEEKKGTFVPFLNDIRDREVIRLWVKEVKYRNTFFFRELIDQVVEVADSPKEAARLVREAMAEPISEEEVGIRLQSAWQKKAT